MSLLNKEKSAEKKYAILRKYFKEHAKKEIAEEEANKLEEILGNFESHIPNQGPHSQNFSANFCH